MEYMDRIRGFSRNARLLLIRSLIIGLGFGTWQVLFNLYLLALGFDKVFVAQMISINWLTHGFMVIPAGIISDLYGRRNVFLIAFSCAIFFRIMRISFLDPTTLLLFSALGGIAEGFHAIVGPPFMAEQSKPSERVHLFSVSATFVGTSLTIGNLMASFLPFLLAIPLGTPKNGAWALRAALICTMPLDICSLIPIYLIREKWQRQSIKAWIENLQSRAIIGMLALTTSIEGAALGFTIPFFNLLFVDKYRASSAEIGIIFSLGAAITALSTLIAPVFVKRLGRVKTIFFIQAMGIPFLILLALSANLWLAGILYILRGIFSGSAAGPGGGMAIPIIHLFPMEIVNKNERGTTNGIIHAMSEFPMAIGAFIAGPMMERGEWPQVYFVAGLIFFVSFLLFLFYFSRVEREKVGIKLEPVSSE